jgi:hypothetical protein
MTEPDRAGTNPTTRREVLKKAAIVGGVVWSMPVIESMTTPAYAGSPPPCGPYDCSQGETHGLTACQCPTGAPGLLIQLADGRCVCASSIDVIVGAISCPPGKSQAQLVNCLFEGPRVFCVTECLD